MFVSAKTIFTTLLIAIAAVEAKKCNCGNAAQTENACHAAHFDYGTWMGSGCCVSETQVGAFQDECNRQGLKWYGCEDASIC